MFDRSHARRDGMTYAVRAVGMRRRKALQPARLLGSRTHFALAKLRRNRIGTRREIAAGGEQLDKIHTGFHMRPDSFAHGSLIVGFSRAVPAVPARRGNRARCHYPRAWDYTPLYRIAGGEREMRKRAAVPNRGDACRQRRVKILGDTDHSYRIAVLRCIGKYRTGAAE